MSSRAVLVTGSSRGIGAACARAFAAQGDRVAVHCRSDRDAADAVLASLQGTHHVVVQGDVGEPSECGRLVDEAVAALGVLDVLVNNAAVYEAGDISTWEGWLSAWDRTLAVNLSGAAHLAWHAARHMTSMGTAGRIVNVGSRGAYRGEPDHPMYGAAKAGLHALGQSLAVSLAPQGIGVATVAPGFVSTDMAQEILDGPRGDGIRAQSPFGRVAEPEEVAAAVVWLASPESLWSSGAVLDLNGASYLR